MNKPKRKSMTYGVMPSKAEFEEHFDWELGGKKYEMTLRGSDARTVQGYGLASGGDFSSDELFEYVTVLKTGFHEDGDEKAGEIASAILETLGFEWV